MATKAQPLKIVDGDDKASKVKEMEQEVTKITKDYTKQVKSLGKKYGMILDVKVLIEHTTNT